MLFLGKHALTELTPFTRHAHSIHTLCMQGQCTVLYVYTDRHQTRTSSTVGEIATIAWACGKVSHETRLEQGCAWSASQHHSKGSGKLTDRVQCYVGVECSLHIALAWNEADIKAAPCKTLIILVMIHLLISCSHQHGWGSRHSMRCAITRV